VKVEYEKDIAVDTNGNVHISFFTNSPNYELWYGIRESGNWSFEPVDSGPDIVGRLNSIDTTQEGTPYIAYYHAPEGALKLAHKTAAGWIVDTVESVNWGVSIEDIERMPTQDLRIGSSGDIYLLYWDSESGFVTLASSRQLLPDADGDGIPDFGDAVD